MRVRRASTSCETSLTILAFSFGDRVVNHFARRYSRPKSARLDDSEFVWKFGQTHNFALPRKQDEVAVQGQCTDIVCSVGSRNLAPT
jgi:hypothetical protein